MAEMTYADAKNLLEAIKVLTPLAANGDEKAKAALPNLREKLAVARQEVGKTEAGYRGFQQGVTLNAADEIGSFIRNPLDSKARQADRANMLAKDEKAKALYPDMYRKGEIAGAGTSALLPFGVAKGGASLGSQLLRMGAAGGIFGGLSGFMGGNGWSDRAQKAIPGAAIGTAIGAAAPIAGRFAGKIANRFTAPAAEGFGRQATGKMVSAIRQHTASGGEDIASYLKGLGPEGMMVDVKGPLQARGVGLAAIGGDGGAMVGRRLAERAQGSEARITSDINAVMGKGQDRLAAKAAIRTQKKTDLGPAYDAALQYPNPLPVTGLKDSMTRLSEAAGPATRKALNKYIKEFGGDQMTAAQIHGIRSDLSDEVNAAWRAGKNKKAAALQAALDNVDGVLDSVPGYTAARQGWADVSSVERALDDGRRLFTGGPSSVALPEEIQAKMKAMTPEERKAFIKGAREYVYSVMGTSRNAPATAWGEFSKGFNREKLNIVLGPKDAERVLKRLGAEKTFSETRGAISGGSKTNMAQEASADLGDLRQPDTLKRPSPISRAKMALDEAGNAVLDQLLSTTGGNLDLGKMLTATGGDRDRLVAELTKIAQGASEPRIAKMARNAIEALTFVAGQGVMQ